MELLFHRQVGGRWESKDTGVQLPLCPGEPSRRGLNAAVRGTTPHPRAEGQLACHLSGLRHHSCADSKTPDSDPGKQSAHAVLGIPIGATCYLARAAGRPQGSTGWRHTPWAREDPRSASGSLWAAGGAAALSVRRGARRPRAKHSGCHCSADREGTWARGGLMHTSQQRAGPHRPARREHEPASRWGGSQGAWWNDSPSW